MTYRHAIRYKLGRVCKLFSWTLVLCVEAFEGVLGGKYLTLHPSLRVFGVVVEAWSRERVIYWF